MNQQPIHRLDLSQSERFLTKMKLLQFWKTEGLAAVGMDPRRAGQPIDQEDTATGVEMSRSSSYSATEHLFTQFDEVLVRFHKMRTDLAQYYNSTNPSVRLQYNTSTGMKMWFQMDGRELDGRDIGVQCISSPHSRTVLDEIKKFVLKNNTTDAGMGDMIRLIKSDNLADIDPIIKSIENKQQQARQQEHEQEQQLQQQQEQHTQQLQQQQREHDDQQKELDRQNKLEVAQIMIAPKVADANAINTNDNSLAQNQLQHNDKMDLERQKEQNHSILEKEKLNLGKQKLQSEDKRTQQQAQTSKLKVHKPTSGTKK